MWNVDQKGETPTCLGIHCPGEIFEKDDFLFAFRVEQMTKVHFRWTVFMSDIIRANGTYLLRCFCSGPRQLRRECPARHCWLKT